MIQIAILDDEQFWRERIAKEAESVLEAINSENSISCFGSPQEIKDSVDTFDIILLDIEMGETDGLAWAKEYRSLAGEALLIPVTSHLEYCKRGYTVDAFRYVTKESLNDELPEALRAAVDVRRQSVDFPFQVVHVGEKIVNSSNIIMIETSGRNILVHTRTGRFEARTPIAEVYSQFSDVGFFQTHKSYLVNMRMVVSYDKESVFFKDGRKARISRKYYSEFVDALFDYRLRMANR